jgi:hypothetical protein
MRCGTAEAASNLQGVRSYALQEELRVVSTVCYPQWGVEGIGSVTRRTTATQVASGQLGLVH